MNIAERNLPLITNDWVEHVIQRYVKVPQTYNPTTAYKILHRCILNNCQRDKQFDPWIEKKAMDACNVLGYAAESLIQMGYLSAGINLLVAGWDHFSEIQRTQETNIRIYKAGIGFYLSRLYYNRGDIGSALRWALLTHTDDALDKHYKGSGAHVLRQSLGLTDDAYKVLNQVGLKNGKKGNGQWTHHSHFAEDVLVDFVLSYPEYSFWLSQPTSVIEYPLCSAYFSTLRDNLKHLESSQEKGAAFEDLATYLMLLIPSWIPQRNISPREQSYEHDIVVNNMMSADNLEVDIYGRNFLVECKYLNRSVNASEVGYFLHRMHLTHTRFGIIFTKDGITGDTEDKYAQNQIYRAYQQDKRICIIFNSKDLDQLETSKFSFRAMLLKKVNKVRFGEPNLRDNTFENIK